MVNLFENTSPSEWLLYISEWTYNNMPTSNIRASTKLAVHCLLAKNDQLQEYGTAFIHNIAGKDVKTVVFDDVAVELAMAVLQFLNSKPSEEHLFRCMKALSRFVNVSEREGERERLNLNVNGCCAFPISGLSGYSAVCADDRTEPKHLQGREWTDRRTDCGDFEEVSLNGSGWKGNAQ